MTHFTLFRAFIAVLVHLAVGLGLCLSLVFMGLAGSIDPHYAWASHFTLLRRGMGDPNLRYYTLVAVGAVLALPVATGLFDGFAGHRAGVRATFAATAGFAVVVLYVLASRAPDMLGTAPSLTVMAGMGIRIWSVFVFIGVALVQIPMAMLAGWIVDRFDRGA